MDRDDTAERADAAFGRGAAILSGADLCRGCIEDGSTDREMHALVNNEHEKCEGCTHQPLIKTLAAQFQANKPRWWVVNGKVLVPIWGVEMLRRFRKF